MSYPTSIDAPASPGAKLSTNPHSTLHTATNTSIVAIETKVGITGSVDTSSIDYKLTNPSSVSPGHKHVTADITDSGAYVQTGSVINTGNSTTPSGFLKCNGTAVSRTTYAALFSVIGTTYGVGDGGTTFNIPNIYQSNLYGNASYMDLGTGNTNKTLNTASALGGTHQNMSFSFWVKMNAEIGSGQQQFFVLRTTSGGTNYIDWWIEYNYNGGSRNIKFIRSKPGVASQSVSYTVALGTTSWHHLAMTYDTATITGYYDGVSVGTAAASGVGNSGANLFVIGADAVSATEAASCLIDDFRVWGYVRSSTDIGTDYSFPRELSGTESNLLAYFRLNGDLTGDFLKDSTSNAYTLTNTNSVIRGQNQINVFPISYPVIKT